MLKYINGLEPAEEYVTVMCKLSTSEFSDVRAEFARSLPIDLLMRDAVDALKRMIFAETETIPLASAILKLMVIHGLDFEDVLSTSQSTSLYAQMTRLRSLPA